MKKEQSKGLWAFRLAKWCLQFTEVEETDSGEDEDGNEIEDGGEKSIAGFKKYLYDVNVKK